MKTRGTPRSRKWTLKKVGIGLVPKGRATQEHKTMKAQRWPTQAFLYRSCNSASSPCRSVEQGSAHFKRQDSKYFAGPAICVTLYSLGH